MTRLACPNCKSHLSVINRNDIHASMCLSGHGVWLDMKVYEKLLGSEIELWKESEATMPSRSSVEPTEGSKQQSQDSENIWFNQNCSKPRVGYSQSAFDSLRALR